MGIRGWHVFWNPGRQRIIKEEKKVTGMKRGREKNSHRMKVKPGNSNDTKSEKTGYPKLGFTKWQEEDKNLNINPHYLLMQSQAGRIISESPVDLAGGPDSSNTAMPCVSRQRSLSGHVIKAGVGCAAGRGATGAEPSPVCVAVRGSGLTATSHHHLTCRQRSDRPGGQ